MTLQQLKYVITVANTGTITEAANRLFISQPSLTNAIHELEKEMNITIFNRTNKGISISKEGAKTQKKLEKDMESMSREELEELIGKVQKQMKAAAADLNFEMAAELRDQMIELKKNLEELDR